MNKTLLICAISVAFAGCSTVKKEEKPVEQKPAVVAPATPYSQKMISSFKRKGIKFEWSCAPEQSTCKNPVVTAIEVTAYATTNGPSEHNRDTAFKVAEMRAKANLRKFIQEDISTSTVSRTLTKNIERANERFKTNASDTSVITASDEDPSKSVSENNTLSERTNYTVRVVTETVKNNAAGILKGIYVADEEVIDNNNVSVTIRWDQKMENINQYLQFKFAN